MIAGQITNAVAIFIDRRINDAAQALKNGDDDSGWMMTMNTRRPTY